jgi:hypothetical protein
MFFKYCRPKQLSAVPVRQHNCFPSAVQLSHKQYLTLFIGSLSQHGSLSQVYTLRTGHPGLARAMTTDAQNERLYTADSLGMVSGCTAMQQVANRGVRVPRGSASTRRTRWAW